jgi:predicted metal-dependent hydrolase
MTPDRGGPDVTRLLPDVPFPPYSYVPGLTPHPVSDPAGHSFGAAPERPPALDPARWAESRAYLRGLDLFNHGYCWEAHEVWEGLWHAAGRRGPTADVLKGLIKLAAAGVKVREGRPQGVRSHARRAADLFRRAAAALGEGQRRHLGLALDDLARDADELAERAASSGGSGLAEVVFGLVLRPSRRG